MCGQRSRALDDDHGRPFGYAFIEERTRIEDHLRRKSGYRADMSSLEFQFRVRRIQDRIHKYRPTMRERQQAWLARQAASLPKDTPVVFTAEELERLVEHFAGANDPVTVSIADKARQALEQMKDS